MIAAFKRDNPARTAELDWAIQHGAPSPTNLSFDQAVERGAEGRRIHIGAAANLEAVSDEVVQIVRGLDGYNRHRFAAEPDLLASWTAACNVIGPPVSGGQAGRRTGGSPPQAGQIKPAA